MGSAQLLIAGTRLTVSPEAQTVPFDTPSIVQTRLEGYDADNGMLPANLRVAADFTGPGIDGVLGLSTLPNQPFRIPRLGLKGQYQLENIRLVQQGDQGDELLAYAEPRSAGVVVTQVLVTRVTSRALTLDEIRNYGIVVDDDSFKAFNFTFGFGVDGETYDYNIPVLFRPRNATDPERVEFLYQKVGLGRSWGTTSARFRPPQIAPFTLTLKQDVSKKEPLPTGGCTNPFSDCASSAQVPIPGVVLFPTDVAMLHQFFSVMVLAKNDAPVADPLLIRDLTAKVVLPPGLRQAQTEPPTPLGVPIPVRVPGPDGELGTGDDITFLVAQSTGQAEVLVEGRQEGVQIVEFQLEGLLDGLPDGQIRRIEGSARGAVLVRDARLGITLTHPEVVRTDEEYSLLLTVSNTSAAPANLISFTLPVSGLSGAVVVGNATQTVASLLPGESEVVELRLLSLRTGRVSASSVRSGSEISPSFQLTTGVGENGVPLSPTSIILPRQTESLPPELNRRALALIGLGFSLATAPPNQVDPTLPQLVLDEIDEKVYWLGQMGRYVAMGEDLFDSAAVFAAEWSGVRDQHWEWDELRRTTQKGAPLAEEIGAVFAQEAAATSPRAAFDRHAATTAFLGPMEGALAVGSGTRLVVSSRTSGLTVAGSPSDSGRIRDLPFAELYDLGAAQMVTLSVPEDNGYQVRLTDSDGGTSALHLRVPEETGALRRVSWDLLTLAPGGLAVVDFQPSYQDFTLFVDTEGDGVVDQQIPGTVTGVQPRPFTALTAIQNPEDPSGHLVEVLFTQDVDLVSLLPLDPQRFTIPGKISNGGLIPAERGITQREADRRAEEGVPPSNPLAREVINPFAGLRDSRIVRIVFNNPISPYLQNALTVRDLLGMTGEQVVGVTLPVQTTTYDPGGLVEGTVYGPDGLPVPFARVDLYEVDLNPDGFSGLDGGCLLHRTASVQADASGHFLFDYVRQTECSDIFSLAAQDPQSGESGTARGRLRFVGATASLDVVMLGRGTVRGRVTYEDGTVPAKPEVIAFSPVFSDGRRASVDANGFYEVHEIPVGTVSLGASDGEGNFVYQTVEIPTAGAVTERNLVIIRRPPDLSTGDVRGTVYASDGVSPRFDAYVALYVDGELVGVQHSALDGSFDFGTVPTGAGEIEAFDGQTGLTGARILFEVLPDQVNHIPVLLQDDRGAVEGHVLRQTNQGTSPVAGAVVWVSGTPFNTVTDQTGFYRLEGVFAGQRTILAADLERQIQVSAAVSVNPDGSTVTRDLIFFDTTSVIGGIAGEVIGFNGSPVSATLHLARPGDLTWWGAWTAGADGRFFIPDLGPGTYEIHAIAGGGGATGRVTIRFKGETPFITLRLKKGTIKGVARVTNESGELVGVKSLVTYRTTTVWQGFVTLDPNEKTLETNADGTFEITNVLTGPYVLTVHNAFYGEKTVRGELFFHGEVQEHEVVFQRNGTIRGRVLDWDGLTPVENATVQLHHPSFSIFDIGTDSEGRFTFDLVPPSGGRFPIDAEIDDGITYRTARVWVRFDRYGQELDVEIVLSRQGTVSGFVEDANGIVVPGAVVTLREHGFPARQLTQNADGEGFFSFRNVFAGRVTVSAQAPSLGGLASSAELTLTGEGEAAFTNLTLEPTGEIAGTVVSPVDGLPVPSVQVALYQWGHGLFDAVTADPFGQFRFTRLPLAQYRVLVFDPRTGRYGLLDGAWVEFNGHLRQVEVSLEVRGDVDGDLREPGTETPIPAATVRLRSEAIVPFTTYSSTDVEGYFEFLGIPEGTFQLRTTEPKGRRQASGQGDIAAEGQRVTVDLYLEESGSVTGSVLNPPGQPDGLFPNVNVLIRQDGQVIGATLDNPFTFPGVIAGRPFEIHAIEMGGDHEGLATGTLSAQGEQVTVDLRMKPIGGVAITVNDSLGNPVSGADVGMSNRGFYTRNFFGWTEYFNGSTAADGRVVFQGVGEGDVSVTALDPSNGLRGSSPGVIALDGAVVEVPVQLQDSGDIVGRVLLSDGLTPAEGALVVVVMTANGRTYQGFADANGDFSFTAVPMGSFLLFVTEQESGPGQIQRGGSLTANGEVVDLGPLVLDDVNPAVVSFDPEPESRDLPRTTAVTVQFSEPLDLTQAGTSWFTFQRFSGGGVGYTLTWPDAMTAVLTPNALLDNFTGYQLIVRDAVDLAGRRLTEQKRTLFYTQDSVPPTVIEFDPRANQNQVPVTANLTVTFSEPVDPLSLSGSAFQLTDLQTGQGVTTTRQQLIGERKVRLTPATGLLSDRQYQLTVQGVRDGSGNTMTAPVSTTFWTVDTTPPEITSVGFPAGTDFNAGDTVPVTVEATDLWGVASATVRLGPGVFTDTDPVQPFELAAVAPYVATPGPVTVFVDSTDVYGNVATTERTIQVTPRSNLSAPESHLGCFTEGDLLMAGREAEVRIRARDDEAVESATFFVDGVQKGQVSFIHRDDSLQSFLWTPPAATAVGTPFTLRVEARDYAGNVTADEVTVTVLDPVSVRTGGGSLTDVVPGTDLILDGGPYFASGPLDLGSLRVLRGGELATVDAQGQRSVLRVVGDLKIECGAELVATSGDGVELEVGGTLYMAGTLEASGLGFAGGDGSHADGFAPASAVPAAGRAGGGHGGAGGPFESPGGPGTPGEVFDSVYWPQLGGGGGSALLTDGGAGGGVAILQGATVVLDGEIRTRGENRGQNSRAAGAGGTVRIEAAVLRGVGGIDASGGFTSGGNSVLEPSLTDPQCRGEAAGGGGGGRVALYVGALDGFLPASQVQAWGGDAIDCGLVEGYAPAGSIYVRLASQSFGELLVDQGEDASGAPREGDGPTKLPELGTGSVVAFEVSGSDAWVSGDTIFRPRWWGAWMVLLDASGAELGSFEVVEIDATGRARLSGAGTMSGPVSYLGEYRFDRVDLLHSAGLDAADRVRIETMPLELDSAQEIPGALYAVALTARTGAVVRPASGTKLGIKVSGTLTVETGAAIDLSGLGWPGGKSSSQRSGQAPSWTTGSTEPAGGSHGGSGSQGPGSTPGLPGGLYDSVYAPRESGGGGAYWWVQDAQAGGAGGGALELDVGTLVLDGELRSRGGSSALRSGGGAGGAVLIRAQTLDGAGLIDVQGADASDQFTPAGAGGGGRVALEVGSLGSFDPQSQAIAWGGVGWASSGPIGWAAPGTVLVKLPTSTYGELVVDAGLDDQGQPRPAPVTELPELGAGAVVLFEVAGADAWVTGTSGFLPRWEGAWMALQDAAGVSLGELEVVEVDGAGRARLAGAATVLAPASFTGQYHFDRVTLLNGAGIESATPITGTTVVFEGEVEVDSEIVATDLLVKSGAVVRPVSGSRLSMVVEGTMTVEAGAVVDLSGLGHLGGTFGHRDGFAPPWMTGSTEPAGGSHGGSGSAGSSISTVGVPGGVYGSVYAPRESGGGGAYWNIGGAQPGGAGGGALELEVGTLVLDGELRARGAASTARTGGGAGGSVLIRAAALTGVGSIDVGGADTADTFTPAGPGAGGRVALHVGSLGTFDPMSQVKASGGAGLASGTAIDWAAPGTLMVKLPTDSYGELILDPGSDVPARATELPELGTGGVLGFEVSGANAWVTGPAGFLARWEGAWMALLDASGADLGVFEILEIDAGGRVLLAGAGTVVGAASYRGEYRFDSVQLAHGAGLLSQDPVQVTSLALEGEAEVSPTVTAGTLNVAAGAHVRPAGGLDLVLTATGDLLVAPGAIVEPLAGGRVGLFAGGTLDIAAGAVIELSGKGWPGGISAGQPNGEAPPWMTDSTPASGGSHGSRGTNGTGSGLGASAGVFGSVYRPREIGGGGAFWNIQDATAGGAGGSALDVEAGILILDGELRSRGVAAANRSAAGAGGSVLVVAQQMQGSGLIDVRGADANAVSSASGAGAGGGGRVGLHLGSVVGFDPLTQVRAQGGTTYWNAAPVQSAAPGTVVVERASNIYGDLILDHGLDLQGQPRPGGVTELPDLGNGAVAGFEVSGLDAWVTAVSGFLPRWEGAWMSLLDGSGSTLGTFEVVEIDGTGRVRLAGAGSILGAASYEGEYRFDEIRLLHGAGLETASRLQSTTLVLEGEAEVNPEVIATVVTVKSGSIVRPASGGELRMTVIGTMTVEAGAVVDVSGLGFAPGASGHTDGYAPETVVGATEPAGGSHGGQGVPFTGVAGEVYGSVYRPYLSGGGGSFPSLYGGQPNGAGGGVLDLQVGTLVLNGELRAQGLGSGTKAAGGAGGSVLVAATSLEGGGVIDASGGDTTVVSGVDVGAGGGGRVGLTVSQLVGFDPATQIRAWGGEVSEAGAVTAVAASGTVLVQQAGQSYGNLRIDHSPAPGLPAPLATVLPEIGRGTVGLIEIDGADPTDLWIEPADPAKLHSLGVTGMWVRVGGTDYPVIAESPDRRRLLLDGAAGAVQVGDAYLGVYRFDTVTVAGSAGLVINDATDDVGQLVVDPTATLQVLDVFPPVITVTDPLAGTLFQANKSIPVSVDVADASTVSQVTFQLGTSTFVDDAPPWQGTVITPDVAVLTDVSIHIEAVDAEGNLGSIDHSVSVDPSFGGPPPTVSVDCPTAGIRLAPGTGLEIFASASHLDGVDRVELLLGADPTVLATDFLAPYQLHFDAPLSSIEGDVLQVKVRAWSTIGTSADALLSIPVVEGAVLTADTYLGPADATLDGGSVIVTGGAVLTVEGSHHFRDLIVLDGGGVTHPISTASVAYELALTLDRDLVVACGGVVDATGHGYPGGKVPFGSAVNWWVGATHAGQSGAFDGTGRIYGNLFDPSDPGGGGGTAAGRAGGGVIRIAAAGQMVIDGTISASGTRFASGTNGMGAGGSIRLDAAAMLGNGSIDASGGSAPSANAGGGGRIALYGGLIDAGLLDRTTATGGDGNVAINRGAAGTVYVKLDSQPLGDLILDNAGRDSSLLTELPAVPPGVVDSVTATSITDLEAAFPHSLAGAAVAFNGDLATLWTITGHTDGSSTLDLDTSVVPLTAVPGDSYQIVYRFDRIVVRNDAHGITLGQVLGGAPEVDASSSWTAGYQPLLTLTQPVAGTQLTAGATVTLQAVADDLFSLATPVTFTFAGQTKTDSSAPYQASFVVPPTQIVSTLEVSVTATDRASHPLVDARSFDWLPTADALAPLLTLTSGPTEGEVVEPGRSITLAVTLTDDELLWGYRFLIDGVLDSETLDVNSSTASTSFTWTPPAGTAAGTVFTLRVEAEDFGANVGSLQRTVVISDPVLSGTSTLDSTLDGQDLVLGAGTFTLTGPFAPASLRLLRDARVVPGASGRLELTVAGALVVQEGTFLDVSGFGFAGGTTVAPAGGVPSWVAGPSPDSGGGHGGVGIGYTVLGPSGEVYDSVYAPDLPGGGGALDEDNNGDGYPGGGVIRIDAGSMVLDGELRARGSDFLNIDNGHAAGGGGTVRIHAGSLSGSGLVDASGGFSNVCWAPRETGSGGGGRVALDVDSLSGFDVASQVRVWGGKLWWCSNTIGRYAAPGTVYVRTLASMHGDLLIDPGTESDGTERTRMSTFTSLPALGSGSVGAVEISGSDLWVTGGTVFQQRWLGAWMVLEDATGADLGTFEVIALDGTGRTLLAGAGTDTDAVSYRGEYRFDRIDLVNGAALSSDDVVRVSGEVLAQGAGAQLPVSTLVTQNLRIPSGSTVTVSQGDRLELLVLGTLTIEAGAVLDVSALGYAGGTSASPNGGAPSWVTGPSSDSGGGHGGVGVGYTVLGPSGEVYDSVYAPDLPGGGGAVDEDNNGDGYPGGGVVQIDAGSVVLDGEIRARGSDFSNIDNGHAAGGGGTVRIHAGSLSGSGLVDASGGFSNVCWAPRETGSGGGGRVALDVDSLSGFDVASQVRAWGGKLWWCSNAIGDYAAPGTVYVRTLTSTYGDLLIDPGTETDGTERTRMSTFTSLPALGSGSVPAVAVSGSDLWVTGGTVFQQRWLGAWMVLEDATGADLGTFEVIALDRTGRALLAGAGTDTDAVSYRGEYRFDRIDLVNGAALSSDDVVRVSGEVLAQGAGAQLPVSTLVTQDLRIPSGSTVTVSQGDRLELSVLGTLTVETGAVLDVAGLGFPGGSAAHPEGFAPPGLQGASVERGGSHGGWGDEWNLIGNPPGEVYDSVYSPHLGGGGAGQDNDGSGDGLPGGGVLEIVAGAVWLDGELHADGSSSDNLGQGGGAGGTVKIVAGSLAGTGSITANGGFVRACATYLGVGTGGGGRVALSIDNLTGFDPTTQVRAWGGTFYDCLWGVYRCSASGTVFAFDLLATHGDLYVTYPTECAGTAPVETILPTIGTGLVSVADPDAVEPADLWIEPQDPLALFDLGVIGMWVRIGASDYRVLDQSPDRRRLLLENAAGIVSLGDTYQGVYKFDTVTARGGTVLEFLDTAEIGTLDVDVDSQVITP